MEAYDYNRQLREIAIPVALQALLASSFSIIDQIMIGQLGSASIAGIGIGSVYSSIFWFGAGSVIAAAGIMIAQYIGQKNEHGVAKSFYLNLLICLGLAVLFMVPTLTMTHSIVNLYTPDSEVASIACLYLSIFAWSFIPQAITNLVSCILRCVNKAIYPTLVSLFGVVLNTALNYCLIFGHFGFPELGVEGAALASLISILASMCLILAVFKKVEKNLGMHLHFNLDFTRQEIRDYVKMLGPMLITEILWVIGDNIYSTLFGHIGTVALAARTISNSIIALLMGSLGGLGQAAAIMVGKTLGEGEFEQAYALGKRLIKTTLLWSSILAIATICVAPFYVQLFHVEPEVKSTGILLLILFAIYTPVKTENMVIGNGILRSGGKTGYVMWLNIFGTWCVGIPLGLLCTYTFHMSVGWVYGILSLEEVVRLALCLLVFKKKVWISSISA